VVRVEVAKGVMVAKVEVGRGEMVGVGMDLRQVVGGTPLGWEERGHHYSQAVGAPRTEGYFRPTEVAVTWWYRSHQEHL
jgi:hypothetical protein